MCCAVYLLASLSRCRWELEAEPQSEPMMLHFSNTPLILCPSPKPIWLAEHPVFQDDSNSVAGKKFWGQLDLPVQSTVTSDHPRSLPAVQPATSSLTHQQPPVPTSHLSRNSLSSVAGRHRKRQVTPLRGIHCSNNPTQSPLANTGELAGNIPQTKLACRPLA